MSELKPCPFCGGDKIRKYGGGLSQEAPVTVCTSCYAQTIGHELWSKRPAENKIKADAVRDAIKYAASKWQAASHYKVMEYIRILEHYANKLERGEV